MREAGVPCGVGDGGLFRSLAGGMRASCASRRGEKKGRRSREEQRALPLACLPRRGGRRGRRSWREHRALPHACPPMRGGGGEEVLPGCGPGFEAFFLSRGKFRRWSWQPSSTARASHALAALRAVEKWPTSSYHPCPPVGAPGGLADGPAAVSVRQIRAVNLVAGGWRVVVRGGGVHETALRGSPCR